MSFPVTVDSIKTFFLKEKSRMANLGIREVGVFGSVVRGEMTESSDIDILIDLAPESGITLFDLIALEQYYSEKLGAKVDLVLKADLRPGIGRKILREVQYV